MTRELPKEVTAVHPLNKLFRAQQHLAAHLSSVSPKPILGEDLPEAPHGELLQVPSPEQECHPSLPTQYGRISPPRREPEQTPFRSVPPLRVEQRVEEERLPHNHAGQRHHVLRETKLPQRRKKKEHSITKKPLLRRELWQPFLKIGGEAKPPQLELERQEQLADRRLPHLPEQA